MKRTPGFTANDGTWFATATECKAHENTSFFGKLVGLTDGDVARAVRREDMGLANAFERVGGMIADRRRKSGELKRVKKVAGQKSTLEAIASDIKKGIFPARSEE